MCNEAMSATRQYGSPNAIIWRYRATAIRLAREAAEAQDAAVVRGNTATVILLAVATFEAFLNVWFRVATEEAQYREHRDSILGDLKRRRSVRYKAREWPARLFGRPLDFSRGAARDFSNLLERRNELMHFTSSHTTVEIPGVTMSGMVDLTLYESLTPKDAFDAIDTIDELVVEFFATQGYSPEQCVRGRHLWFGRVALPEEIAAAQTKAEALSE